MRNAKRLLSIVLVVLMLFSMSMVATSAYTVPDGYAVAPGGTTEENIQGDTVGIIGDADMNDAVNVRDATLIQKFAADLAELSDVQKLLADVNFDKIVNVKDATPVQKRVAGLETLEPVNQLIYVPEAEITTTTSEEPSTPTASAEATTTTDVEIVEPSSSEAVTSGDEVEPTSTTEAGTEPTSTTEVGTEPTSTTEAGTEPTTTTQAVTVPTTTTEAPEVEAVTVYFSNNRYWDEVRVHYWGGATSTEWPGAEMTLVETNEYGQDIYKITLPEGTTGVVFNNNNKGQQTVDITPENGIGYYCEGDNTPYPAGTYTYVPSTPVVTTTATVTTTEAVVTTTTEAEVIVPTTTTEAEVVVPTTTTIPATADTVTVYFSNNKGWEKVYIYGFYGVEGGTATGEPLGKYPGAEMTFVEKNDLGEAVYSAAVPADIDYIKFTDGTSTNNRTNNIPNTKVAENAGFYLTDSLGNNKWDYGTYTYVPSTPVVTTTAAVTTTEAVVTTTTEAEVIVPTTTTEAEVEVPTTADEVEPTTTTQVVTVPTTTEAPEVEAVTVYFSNNRFWDEVRVHYWGGAASTEWPGAEMTFVEKNEYGQDIYKITLPEGTTGVVFNNNNKGQQTADITPENGIGYYCEGDNTPFPAGTYTYVPSTPVVTTTAAVTTTEAVVTTTTEAEVIVPTTTTEAEVVVPTTADEVEPTTTTQATTVPTTTEAPEVEAVTVYFSNNRFWDEVRVHYWGGAASTEWPGAEMTFVEKNEYGQDIYKITLPEGTTGVVFNNNNKGQQTVDITPENGIGYYCDGDNTPFAAGTYTYVPSTPVVTTTAKVTTTVAVTTTEAAVTTTTEAEVIVPTTTTEAEVVVPTTTTIPATADTVTVYFSNNKGWEKVYIYGFYGVEGGTATGEPLGKYPGTEMTFVEKNDLGEAVYSAAVPADIDYIKFTDGTSTNNRTNNIPKTKIAENAGFYLTDSLGNNKWDYGTYTYVPTVPVVTTTAKATTTVTVTTTEAVVTTTTEAEVIVPTTTTEAEVEVPTTADEVEPTTTEAPQVEAATVYFSNNRFWDEVRVHYWGGATSTEWPGAEMTLVETNEYGQDIYKITLPEGTTGVVFNNNNKGQQTVDITPENGIGYYCDGDNTPFAAGTYTYVPSTPVVTTTAVATTTVAVTTTEAIVTTTEAVVEPTTTTEAEVVVPTTTTEAEVPEPEAITVYAINSVKWDTVAAYYWGGVDVSWPGTVMTKTADTVNGFDVYSMTFETAPQNIIFNNNNNGSQTADLTFEAGKYFDIKAGKWYASLSEVPEINKLSTDRYLAGSFNGWSTVANEFTITAEGETTAYVEMELEANTTYEFKIVRQGTWTSCKTTLNITNSATGLVFSSGVSDNTKITTKAAGTYVFAFGLENSQLSVTYPA